MMQTRGLQKVMDAAKLVEDWSSGGETTEEPLVSTTKGSRAANGKFQAQTSKPAQQGGQGPKTKPNQNSAASFNSTSTKPNHNRLKPPFRRLTPAEVTKWKAEGLCFRCDEKYVYPHKCAQVELVEKGEPEGVEVAEISISSIVGISSSRTIKLRGTMMGRDVVVLIDSGATHNFVSKDLVQELKLSTDKTRGYSVLTAGGVTFTGAGRCSELELELPRCTVTSSFLPLELGSADVILGIQWLETLGNMKVNWKLQILRFRVGTDRYVLQGDPSLRCAAVSFKSLMKTMQQEEEAMLVEYNGVQVENEVSKKATTVPPKLQKVLEEYTEVFNEPQGLPPSRGREHAIVLNKDASPVSVRPFRYPQAQREEIEKQVAAMLAAGIIRDSNSPFSSPVLLVKKKMGAGGFASTIEL